MPETFMAQMWPRISTQNALIANKYGQIDIGRAEVFVPDCLPTQCNPNGGLFLLLLRAITIISRHLLDNNQTHKNDVKEKVFTFDTMVNDMGQPNKSIKMVCFQMKLA